MLKQIDYKDISNLPEIRGVANAITTSAAGVSLCSDPRDPMDGDPNIFQLGSASVQNQYNALSDGWISLQSPQLSAFAAGSTNCFHPSAGPRGLIQSGATTTTIPLGVALVTGTTVNSATVTSAALFGNLKAGMGVTGQGINIGTRIQSIESTSSLTLNQPWVGDYGTANGTAGTPTLSFGLISSVGVNQLSNNGNDKGFKIRIIDNGAGGTGKIEERYIDANTSGSIPTVTLDSALSFTPVVGSTYEILSGRVYNFGNNVITTFTGTSTNGITATLNSTSISSSSLFLSVPLNVPLAITGTGFVPGCTVTFTSTSAGTLSIPFKTATNTTTTAFSVTAAQVTGGATTINTPIVSFTAFASTTVGAITGVLVPGMYISGTGIPAGARILKVLGTGSIVMNCNATATNSSLTFTITGGGFTYYSQLVNDVFPLNTPANITNAPSTFTVESQMVALSECMTPYNKTCSEGFFGQITASATAAGTITSTAAGAGDDAAKNIAANAYRNFQVRIVEDTSTPTAVGQRRRIASHTAGVSGVTSPVYTLYTNWTVTPSANAKFVIEMDDDKLILFNGQSPYTFTYNISTDTWDTTTFTNRGIWTFESNVSSSSNYLDLASGNTSNFAPGTIIQYSGANGVFVSDVFPTTRLVLATSSSVVATSGNGAYAWNSPGTGCATFQSYGIDYDANTSHGLIYSFRGAATPVLDVFDITAAAAGAWTINIPYGTAGQTSTTGITGFTGFLPTTGSSAVYAPRTHQGKYAYIYDNATLRIYRFDVADRKLMPAFQTMIPQSTAVVGNKLVVVNSSQPESVSTINPKGVVSFLYIQGQSISVFQSVLLQ